MRKMTLSLTMLLAGLAALMGVSSPARAAAIYRVVMTVNGVDYCLDADNNGTGRNGNKVQVWQCNGLPNQQWELVGDQRLQNVWAEQKRKYVHAGYLHRTADGGGAAVTLADIQVGPQFWNNLRPGAPAPHPIWSSGNPSLCLDADSSGGGVVNGRKVQLYQCHGGANQLWRLAVA